MKDDHKKKDAGDVSGRICTWNEYISTIVRQDEDRAYRRGILLQTTGQDSSLRDVAERYLNEVAIPMTVTPFELEKGDGIGLAYYRVQTYLVPAGMPLGATLTDLRLLGSEVDHAGVEFVGQKERKQAIDDFVDRFVETINTVKRP